MSYYNTNPGQPQFVTADWVKENGGIDPGIATPQQLADAGFYLMVVEPEPEYDPSLASIEQEQGIVGTNYVVSYKLVPFPTSTYTTLVKSQAYSILQPTDWMVVRQVEDSVPIPTEWQEWRRAVRLESSTKIAAIEACGTYEELHEYMNSEAYSTWPTSPDSPDAP